MLSGKVSSSEDTFSAPFLSPLPGGKRQSHVLWAWIWRHLLTDRSLVEAYLAYETDYPKELNEIEHFLNAVPTTPEGDRLEVLTALVEAYEEEHYHILWSDPIEAIHHYMEGRGVSRRDLEPYIGSRARISEVLNRERPLVIDMIRRLNVCLGISVEVLIQFHPLE
jgi:HTH-type transcriptional regulator/antitoxin HigA